MANNIAEPSRTRAGAGADGRGAVGCLFAMEDALYDCQLVLTTLGLALGAVAAGAATRLVAGFLVDVSPTDPAVFTVTGLVLAGAALLACLVPSRRAAKADPLATLRAD